MKFFALALLLLLAPATQGQTFSFEDTQLPEGWSKSGAVTVSPIKSNGTGRSSVMLSGTLNPTLISNRQESVGMLRFFVLAYQRPDFDLIVETSNDGNNWTRITTPITYSPQSTTLKPEEALFTEVILPVNILGEFRVRWTVPRFVSGLLFIDDITFEKMNDEQKELARIDKNLNATRELVKATVIEKAQQVEYAQALTAFSNSERTYRSYLLLLASLNRQTKTIHIISRMSTVTAARSEMANPYSYTYFEKLTNNLQKVLPKTKSNRVTNLIGLVKNVATVGASLASSFTGVNFRTMAESLKGLFADGYTNQNMEAQKKDLEQQVKQEKEKKTPESQQKVKEYTEKIGAITEGLQHGETYFENAQSFLDIMADENDKLAVLNGQVYALDQEAELLAADMRKNLKTYLETVSKEAISDSTLDKVIALDPNEFPRVGEVIKNHYKNKLGEQAQFSNSLSADQLSMLREMEIKFRQADELRRRYDLLTVNLRALIIAYQKDLTRESPLKAELDVNGLWDVNKRKALAALAKLPEDVDSIFKNVNLFIEPQTPW